MEVIRWETRGSDDTYGFACSEQGQMEGSRLSQLSIRRCNPSLSPNRKSHPMAAGEHGGSEGNLTEECITALLLQRTTPFNHLVPEQDSVSGVLAHQLSLEDGKPPKLPQFKWPT